MRKLSRLEASKEVRRVLNRNGVDLSYAQYSVGGMDIRFTGILRKTDTSDFNCAQVEKLIHECQRVLPNYTVSGEFDNWKFTTDHIQQVGEKASASKEEESSDNQSGGFDYDSEAS